MAEINSQSEIVTKEVLQDTMSDFYLGIYPYLNGAAHAGFTPVGTVIVVMGNTAPANYLACNGQIVNIADYKELADYFEAQFGTKNHFGGDGTTTFGIPTKTSGVDEIYCIATKNIYIDARVDYSTDEKVVGTWIDSKPVYQLTVIGTTPSTIGTQIIIADNLATNVNEVVSIDSSFSYAGDGDYKTLWLPMVGINNDMNKIIKILPAVKPNDTLCLSFYNTQNAWASRPYICTIQYTKTTDV